MTSPEDREPNRGAGAAYPTANYKSGATKAPVPLRPDHAIVYDVDCFAHRSNAPRLAPGEAVEEVRCGDYLRVKVRNGTASLYRADDDGLDMGRIATLTINQGQHATLTFANETMMWHPMHLHGHLLGHQIRRQCRTAQGHRHRQAHADVAVRLVADHPGVWMLHYHKGYHMDAGMMITLNYTG